MPTQDFQLMCMHFQKQDFTIAPLPKMRTKYRTLRITGEGPHQYQFWTCTESLAPYSTWLNGYSGASCISAQYSVGVRGMGPNCRGLVPVYPGYRMGFTPIGLVGFPSSLPRFAVGNIWNQFNAAHKRFSVWMKSSAWWAQSQWPMVSGPAQQSYRCFGSGSIFSMLSEDFCLNCIGKWSAYAINFKTSSLICTKIIGDVLYFIVGARIAIFLKYRVLSSVAIWLHCVTTTAQFLQYWDIRNTTPHGSECQDVTQRDSAGKTGTTQSHATMEFASGFINSVTSAIHFSRRQSIRRSGRPDSCHMALEDVLSAASSII